MPRLELDGSFFIFPEGWHVETVDQWTEQKNVTAAPFKAKSCDLIAYFEEDKTVWIIEAKDYTYPGAQVPRDLADTVAQKIFHTLAVVTTVALWGEDRERKQFCQKVLSSKNVKVCLAIELPDGGRKLQQIEKPLSDLLEKLKHALRPMKIFHPVVSNSHQRGGAPWKIERNPEHREQHQDR